MITFGNPIDFGAAVPDGLKPCPFCGRMPELRRSRELICRPDYRFEIVWQIRCIYCFTRKEATSVYRVHEDETITVDIDGKKKVVEMWNQRADLQEAGGTPGNKSLTPEQKAALAMDRTEVPA